MPRVNRTEMLKLMKHDGRAVLILFDFSRHGLDADDLSAYRELPSMGRGNHARSPFSVAYFGLREDPVRLNIRT